MTKMTGGPNERAHQALAATVISANRRYLDEEGRAAVAKRPTRTKSAKPAPPTIGPAVAKILGAHGLGLEWGPAAMEAFEIGVAEGRKHAALAERTRHAGLRELGADRATLARFIADGTTVEAAREKMVGSPAWIAATIARVPH